MTLEYPIGKNDPNPRRKLVEDKGDAGEELLERVQKGRQNLATRGVASGGAAVAEVVGAEVKGGGEKKDVMDGIIMGEGKPGHIDSPPSFFRDRILQEFSSTTVCLLKLSDRFLIIKILA